MSAWITDRLPTVEEADTVGEVTYCRGNGEIFNVSWREIVLGEPWCTPTYPEPYVKEPVWGWGHDHRNFHLTWKGWKCAWFLSQTQPKIGTRELQAMTDALNRLEEGV